MEDLRQRMTDLWWLVLLRGITGIIFGLLWLTAPGATLATLAMFLGAYWFVDGIFSLVSFFTGQSESSRSWSLLSGILGILAGLVVLKHPLASALFVPTMIVIIIGVVGLTQGAIRTVEGFKIGAGALIFGGVVQILLSAFLLSNPIIGVAVLPFTLGILALVGGIILTVNAIRLRKLM